MSENQTLVVDTHLHFWDLNSYAAYTDWMQDSPELNRTLLPSDVKPHFEACAVDRGVIIEAARGSHALNLWWLSLAERYAYIGAVVTGCFLEQPDLAAWFDEYAHSPCFAGIRSQPRGAPESWAGNADTERGLNELARRDLSLDLLVTYESFEAVRLLAARHPSLRIILDHCGGPPIREEQLDLWAKHLAPLAAQPNIVVKYSSLLLYAEPDISVERVRPVADFLMKTFGAQRLLWGSNWPVELKGGSYEQSFQVAHAAISPLTTAVERAAIYGGNAVRFYRVR